MPFRKTFPNSISKNKSTRAAQEMVPLSFGEGLGVRLVKENASPKFPSAHGETHSMCLYTHHDGLGNPLPIPKNTFATHRTGNGPLPLGGRVGEGACKAWNISLRDATYRVSTALIVVFLLMVGNLAHAQLWPFTATHNYYLKPVKTITEVGISDPTVLSKIDRFVADCIAAGAFPGCRVLAAVDGKVFYDRAFGKFNYYGNDKVDLNTVYDLASLTKVVATNMAIMRLYEQGKVKLDGVLGDYLPITKGTDKASLKIRNLLLHQAGLKSWIPFYRAFFDSTKIALRSDVFQPKKTKDFTLEVAEDLWMRRDFKDSIWKVVLESPLENLGRMVYSDLDFYFLAAVAEAVSGKTIDRYVMDEFYVPLGLKTIGYNPLQFIKKSRIAPTEDDQTFRHQLLQGYVHDPGAALFGGVAGHAGVFATAGNVAALFQMLLNGGIYGGKVYFQPETVRLFSAYNSRLSRRGLGFDKASDSAGDGGPAGDDVSGYAFGHQGFTGTCAWADPETGIVFVFLSNRVNPDQENPKINRLSVRTKIQDMIYDALGIKKNTQRPEVKNAQLSVLNTLD